MLGATQFARLPLCTPLPRRHITGLLLGFSFRKWQEFLTCRDKKLQVSDEREREREGASRKSEASWRRAQGMTAREGYSRKAQGPTVLEEGRCCLSVCVLVWVRLKCLRPSEYSYHLGQLRGYYGLYAVKRSINSTSGWGKRTQLDEWMKCPFAFISLSYSP